MVQWKESVRALFWDEKGRTFSSEAEGGKRTRFHKAFAERTRVLRARDIWKMQSLDWIHRILVA